MRRSPLLLASLAVALPLVAAAEKAGVSAAVRGSVALTREAQQVVGRQVASGEDILLDDTIESGPRSGMQILLLDQTVFTIGPDSALVIDDFVYDPDTETGELTAEVVKGVFRFVTGKVAESDPEQMEVRLPVGNIGIRGTMVAGRVRPDRSALVFLLGEGPRNDQGRAAGAFEASNAGVSEWIRRPGWGVELLPGMPPRVLRVDPEVIREITGLLENPTGARPVDPGGAAWWAGSPSVEGLRWAAEGGDAARASARNGDGAADGQTDVFEAVQGELDQQTGLSTVADLMAQPPGQALAAGPANLAAGDGSYDFTYGLDFAQGATVARVDSIASLLLQTQAADTGNIPGSIGDGIGGFAVYRFEGLAVDSGSPECAAGCPTTLDVFFFEVGDPQRQRADHELRIQNPDGSIETGGAERDVPLQP